MMGMGETDGMSSTVGSPARSAKHHGNRQAGFAGFFVLAVHLLGGLGQRQDAFVETDAMPGLDLIAGDRVGGPGLDRAERTPLDAWHLHVTGDRVTGHTEVVL